ncbi:redox-regulated ATPase YchF [Mycoplasmoides genitalium]|uniref:Ribosome-binding ATPase YchF n=2 Tax=Mycoplasmoides genitalium TaxID=2097 RepID=YCHF_MYCGE|nr:redox-regulated ATPase YchF [Mycoplasmoides genitalium]P47270.1 RecName: Full=Ribosome-binding ATPase YchF [Mycoplasmoides genitalium G37]AAC71240.1 GTP-binding protein YchF [Mycoplasmoides genitalium G37]ABY79269.1 GTP-binding protein YchF [synthetic Mycoplasma genitalium JCVI-1.0]AFQ03816.1 GTP-binding protein YchF [Mycoplasmoides genitalium M6320]
MLSAGIVGLPNVGKSTLFSAITNLQVEIANYPFATIEPNTGIVNVSDERLDKLASLINPEKIVYTTFRFVDIAGLVKGASQGQGLGNQFLANIREVDLICHVVRCFQDKKIVHVNNTIDPVFDFEIIVNELIQADFELITNRIGKLKRKAESGDKIAKEEFVLLEIVLNGLKQGQMPIQTLSESELKTIKSLNLLTAKPILIVANVSENDLLNLDNNEALKKLNAFLDQKKIPKAITVCSLIEKELSGLKLEQRQYFLDELGLKNYSGLNRVIQAAYQTLNLWSFFTFGKKEVRAWTFKKGWNAPQCAGQIHSDFEKGFIKVEVISWDQLFAMKSLQEAKKQGLIRLEGKNYLIKDGDVCNFKFNVT